MGRLGTAALSADGVDRVVADRPAANQAVAGERERYRLPPITLLSLIIEIGLVSLSLALFARSYQDFDPALRPRGGDWVYLTASGSYAGHILARTGAIPLWNPFVGGGEPLIEGIFSFVLNPFMFLPIAWGGLANGGKLAILIHLVLMASGGWLLGRVMRLRPPGRVALALLLAGHGGWVAAVGEGHYQIGLSQAYLPWVLAGLVGTLHLRRRWPIALLSVAATLMLFAGSFWHVLPTVITCALVTLLGIWEWRGLGRLGVRLNLKAAMRVVAALMLVALLSAIRLLPIVDVLRYTYHPAEELGDLYTLGEVLTVYLAPTAGSAGTAYWLRYAYTFPGLGALLLIGLLIGVLLMGAGRVYAHPATVQVIVAAVVGIVLYTGWARGATPAFTWLYTTFPGLGHWRRMGRLAAAAAPLIALLIAMLADTVIMRLYALHREQGAEGASQMQRPGLRGPRRLPLAAVPLLMLIAVTVTGYGCFDVLNNWQRVAGLAPVDPFEGRFRGVSHIREVYPTRFLSIDTKDIATSAEFVAALARMLVGNPEVFLSGVPATIGTVRFYGQPAEFAAGMAADFLESRLDAGYQPVPGSPFVWVVAAWEHPQALSYAFTVAPPTLRLPGPLLRSETQSVAQYAHRLDDIHLSVASHAPGDLLIVHETPFPGWVVRVDGQPAAVESIGWRLGVRLPATSGPTEVVFSYHPTWLYLGAVVSAVGVLAFVAFVFRWDRRVRRHPRTWWGPARER
jgi:hypothetical protein